MTAASQRRNPRPKKRRPDWYAGVGQPNPELTAQLAISQAAKQIKRYVLFADVRGELYSCLILAACGAVAWGVFGARNTWVLASLVGAITALAVRGHSEAKQAAIYLQEQLRNMDPDTVHEVRLHLAEMPRDRRTSLQFAAQLRYIERARATRAATAYGSRYNGQQRPSGGYPTRRDTGRRSAGLPKSQRSSRPRDTGQPTTDRRTDGTVTPIPSTTERSGRYAAGQWPVR
jgi:hypothetical protein